MTDADSPRDRTGVEAAHGSVCERFERGELSARISSHGLSSFWFVTRNGECIAAGVHGPACDTPHLVSVSWVERILADNAGQDTPRDGCRRHEQLR